MRLRAVLLLACVLALALGRDAEAAAPRGAEALYARTAPAIAYLETATAAGSGILIDGGYLLTDAHVVWPYDTVDRVRFPDGRVLRDVPVVAQDMLADLALLRVGELPGIQPLTFGDPTRVAVGSEVYLVGYPAERQPHPTPTFSRGLLSRIRIGGPLDLPFAQTDALSAPGGSGGAMLSDSGEVIGIVQLRYPSTSFTLALGGAQAVERMRAQISGMRSELGPRRYGAIATPMIGADRVQLSTRYEQQAYLIRTPSPVEVTVTADSSSARLVLYDPTGDVADRSATSERQPGVTVRTVPRLPYVLVASGTGNVAYQLTSDYPMLRIPDPDDRRTIMFGSVVYGSFDHPGDTDTYSLDLREGQTVAITAESTLADTVVAVTRADVTGGSVLDSTATTAERGLLGNDAVLNFTAAGTRRYTVIVADLMAAFGGGSGAYRLSVFQSRPARTVSGYGAITSGDRPGTSPGAFVFGGGTEDDLITATGCSRAALRVWASTLGGQFVAFVPGAAVTAVNAAWSAQFPFGIPAGTALLGQCPRDP